MVSGRVTQGGATGILAGVELSFVIATEADVSAIAALRRSVTEQLTQKHGRGHWSSCPTEASVLRGLRASRILLARDGEDIVGTLRLATKKPWAIDLAYFHVVPKALYLHDMAVAPALQGRGIGRRLVQEAVVVARAWPSAAVRLDAYDAEAGAGSFYAKCGFTEVGRVTYRKTPLIYFELLL
jgi:GNAT superfamily N-acetyltransferase